MQNQEHIYDNEPRQPDERGRDIESREQTGQQAYTYQAYEEGYAGLDERSMGGLLALIALLCAVFIAGSLFGAILSWLSWLIVVVLVVAGLGALATNWRVVTIPMPTRTFRIMEHARLVINNGSGRVAVRRGEEGVISVNATKRASGFGIDAERMQINYDQRGDTVNISTEMNWSIFQLGLRSVDFEIAVPASCDVQLDTGSGRVSLQDTSGDIRVRTGSGRVEVQDAQGRLAIKTGSGGIRI